jgi:putative transposase
VEYVTKNHSKFLLMYHFIFVLKYRKKIIDRFPIKDILQKISDDSDFNILKMETDKDHIHLLVQTEPKISPLRIVKTLKGKSTIVL